VRLVQPPVSSIPDIPRACNLGSNDSPLQLHQFPLDPFPKFINGKCLSRNVEGTSSISTVEPAFEWSRLRRVYTPRWSATFAGRVRINNPACIIKHEKVTAPSGPAFIVRTARVSLPVLRSCSNALGDLSTFPTSWRLSEALRHYKCSERLKSVLAGEDSTQGAKDTYVMSSKMICIAGAEARAPRVRSSKNGKKGKRRMRLYSSL
jgi:hypothetical protein